jgi:hypothetical protein
VGKFGSVHAFGDYADDLAAAGQHTIGQGAHQAGAPATIDQRKTAPGERLAHSMGRQNVFAGGLAGRTTIDTDGFHRKGSGGKDKIQKTKGKKRKT